MRDAWIARDRLILGRSLATCAFRKFADLIESQETPAQMPTGYQTKKVQKKKSGTSNPRSKT
jgi:hypothetical protein